MSFLLLALFLRVADEVWWTALTSMSAGWSTSWNKSTQMLRKHDKAAGRLRLLLRLGSFECFLGDDWNGALQFRRHAFSGSLGTLGVEWLCLSKRCTDVVHRHVLMCCGYVLGDALAVEIQNPFTVSPKPGYALRLIDILVIWVCFYFVFLH